MTSLLRARPSLRRVASLVSGLVTLLLVPFAAASSDAELLKKFNEDSARIRQQMAGNSAPEKLIVLIQEQKQLQEKLLAEISAEMQPMLTVVFAVITPLQENGEAYVRRVAQIVQSGKADFSTISRQEEIDERRQEFQDMLTANLELLDQINAIENDAEKALAKTKLSEKDKREFLRSFSAKMSSTIGPMRAIRALDTKMIELWFQQLDLLKAEWGRWTGQKQVINFENPEANERYQEASSALVTLADRQVQAQQLLVNRL